MYKNNPQPSEKHSAQQNSSPYRQALGHFDLIQDTAHDFIRSQIAGFSLVSQADTMAQYIEARGEPPKPIISFSSFKSYFSG